MHIKKILLLLSLLVATTAMAQNRIPNTPIEFTMPEGQWKFLQTTKVDRNTNVYLYSYKGRHVIDSLGDTILPYLSVYVQQNHEGELYDFVYSRYLKHPYQSLSEQQEGFAFPNAIAYIGAYTNTAEQKDYLFRMLYFKHKNTVYEIRLETSADTFDEFDSTFQSILNSVKAYK